MKLNWLLVGAILLTFVACVQKDLSHGAEQAILQAEKAFNDMAASQGVKEAFLHFAADSAVILRSRGIIKGKEDMADYFDSLPFVENTLSWHPEFVKASKSGDIGYTYGPFEFFARDTTGEEIHLEGTFHTVWQLQPDGEWKFVYD